jgi:hypothetical protein
MKLHPLLAALIFLLSAIPGFPRTQDLPLSMPSYLAELDRLSAAVENSQMDSKTLEDAVKGMPPQWKVQIDNRIFQIHSEWIRDGIRGLLQKKSDDARRLLLSRIAALKFEAREFQQPKQDASQYRNALAGILARREFQNTHGPTWWDSLKNRILLVIAEFLGRIFGSSAFPVVGKIFVWILVIAAVAALGIWMIASLRRNARLEAIELKSNPVSAKLWDDWMAEARSAAANDAWREAVHYSYWAGISFLESRGLWRPDPARTPREYLRLIKPSSEYRSSLSALTRQFEAVWYGYADVGPDSFTEALNILEIMGCRSN